MRSDGASDWQEHSLYELADYVNGRATKLRELVADGVPVIKIAELSRGITDTTNRVPSEVVQQKHWVRAGDLVFAWSGSVGIHIYGGQAAALNQHIFRVIAKPDVCDQRFLRYLLTAQLPVFERFVASKRTTMGHVTVADLRSTTVRVPSKAEQERIAVVLGALDDKIDSNRRLASLLEETAATIFKARFVDFVGVEDLEDSEIGPIPRGWRTGSLIDVAKFVNGKAFTKDASGVGRPIIRIRELNNEIDANTPLGEIDADDDHVAHADDILFAWSGSLDVYHWPGPEALINQHIFKVVPQGWPSWYVFRWIEKHMTDFRAIAQDKATTMGHIQRRHLGEASVVLPDADAIAKADRLIGPLDRMRAALVAESRTLAEIRDKLLPKLVSGQIRVPDTTDAEEVIGPAADEGGAAS